MSAQLTRRRLLRASGAAGVLGIAGCLGSTDRDRWTPAAPLETAARQYSAPGCGCCGRYAAYLRENLTGALAESAPGDVDAVKREHGVPASLRSCHTVVLSAGGYVVEGHVPATVIARLLAEQPAIRGVALPGMPAGTPGMPGEPAERLTVYALGGGRTGEAYAEL